MAKGYPDYFGQSVFPKYGPMTILSSLVPLIGAGTTTLVTVDGQGNLSYLELNMISAAGLTSAQFAMYIDGSKIQDMNLQFMMDRAIVVGSNQPLVLSYAKLIDYTFQIELSHALPYGLSFKLTVQTGAIENALVSVRAGYHSVL